MGGIKGFKNVKGGMYQKRLGTTDLDDKNGMNLPEQIWSCW